MAPSELDPAIAPALSQVVLKLLAKTAEDRYQSALGLRADLERCVAEWLMHRAIRPFPLATQDISDRFSAPQRLYGRDRQLTELLQAFDEARNGPPALLLVAGYSGIGKTALIQELYKPLVRERGYFISGKFDQLEHNIPYRALMQAFQRLVHRWLAEGEERLQAWRTELGSALGSMEACWPRCCRRSSSSWANSRGGRRSAPLKRRTVLSACSKAFSRSSPRRNIPRAHTLDMATMIKAAQAIASEIEQEKLMAILMRIAIENAGAERACLILEREGEAFVCAEGSVDTPASEAPHEPVPLSEANQAPASIVNYVRRTAQSLVIADARRDDRYLDDLYVIRNQPLSVLCVPVLNQGRLTGVLYLENNLVTDAFTPERIEIMQILAAQAAISLHNARLYDERRRAEAALKESEAQYQDLYDNAPDMFVSVDAANARIIRCNLTLSQAMGYTRDEILGRPIFDMYHPDCLAQVRRNLATFLETGEVRNSELRLRRKDGSTLEVMLNSSAVRDADGRILHSRSVWRDITERKRAEVALQRALLQVEELKNRLQDESAYLQEEIKLTHNFEEMVGGSPALRTVLRNVEAVAATDATVLIQGETGTGKELIARAVHDRSKRRGRALVKVNCAAISAGLVESELFGHVKGAFTGAVAQRTGRFELANGGTIFLDEVGELPPDTQVKLLRALQEQEFEPVGSSRTVRVDVRVIAATNRDLEKAVQEGRFRADLFYRLNVFPIRLPSLRERREDIPQLVLFFMARFAKKFGKRLDRVGQETMEKLVNYRWPGNIRDLQNIVERAAILSPGSTLTLDWELPVDATSLTADRVSTSPVEAASVGATDAAIPLTLEHVERRHIIETLKQAPRRHRRRQRRGRHSQIKTQHAARA